MMPALNKIGNQGFCHKVYHYFIVTIIMLISFVFVGMSDVMAE